MSNLVEEFLSGWGAGIDDDATATAILDATQAEVGQRGIAKASLDAIAKRAGVNRVTLYRRFTDREGLMAAWAAREGARMTRHLANATEPYAEPRQRLVEAFVAAASYAQDHPFVQHMARRDPASFVRAFTANDTALLRLGAGVAATEIRSYHLEGCATHLDADAVGETLARLMFACVLLPGGLIDVFQPHTIRTYAESTLVPLVFGPDAAGEPSDPAP